MHFVYSHGYAIPDYVEAEPKIPRGGVFRTKYARRRTYDDLSPGFSLGSDEAGGSDPIEEFGKKSARIILSQVMTLPPAERKKALQAALAELDPKLWDRADARATALRAQGVPAMSALEQGLSENLSLGLLEEFARVGKAGKVPPRGMLSAGINGPERALSGYAQAMGGIFGAIGSFGSTVVKTVGSLACTAASSPGGIGAAGVAGGSVAASGAAMLAGACGKGQQQVVYAPPPQKSSMMPIILVGVAIVAAILLTRPQ